MNDKLSTGKLAKLTNTELAQISSEVAGRLGDADWQKIAQDLQASGHIDKVYQTAPYMLQRFFKLDLDLGAELARHTTAAPLMSTIKLIPRRPRGEDERLIALLSTQDSGATLHVEVFPDQKTTVYSFGIKHMLTLRFNLPNLDADERRAYLELMHRDTGIVPLWTLDRWEKDHLIFVRQEFYTQVHAFSASFEATARMTNEVTGTLLDWLERCWFPRRRTRQTAPPPVPQQPNIEEQLRTLPQIWEQLARLENLQRQVLCQALPDEAEMLMQIFDAVDGQDETRQKVIQNFLKENPDLVQPVREKLINLISTNPESFLGGATLEMPSEEDDKFNW